MTKEDVVVIRIKLSKLELQALIGEDYKRMIIVMERKDTDERPL